MMFTDASDSEMRDSIVRRAKRMNSERIVEQLRVMMMWDAGRASSVLSQLKVPLTLLQSTAVGSDKKRTMLTPGSTSDYIDTVIRLVPDVSVQIVSDCGHFTQLEAADDTINAIRECAASVRL